MIKWKVWPTAAGFMLTAGLLFGVLPTTSTAAPRAGSMAPLARGGRISSVALPEARGTAVRGHGAPSTTCSTPGAGNYKADCNSTGRATNETWIAYNGTTFVAGANDYNSYNGQADWGYYTSPDGKTWTDDGPLDLFAHDANHAAGDPGLAIDDAGVAYYSGISFSYVDCNFGGVELARRDPSTGTWTNFEIAANSDGEFQDKSAIMLDERRVYVSWTQYGSCDGIGVPSPIKVAVFDNGPTSGPPLKTLSVPGSLYSQGSAMVSDGKQGFWITWEEFSDPFDTNGEIRMAHFRPRHRWSNPQTISPIGFTDLPSPLPGFLFRDNSFPMITLAANKPKVVWTSYDTGAGRAYLWSNGTVTTVSDTGGDQFFPAIATDSSGVLAISYSQTDPATSSYDRYLVQGGPALKVSTASSFPNSDPFFGGAFIGDYEAITVAGTTAHPIWTDLRGPSFDQNAMVYSP
jgi:hypothetical protein